VTQPPDMPWPVLPPAPEGAIGWNVFERGGFIRFVPDEEAVGRLAAEFADDVESFTAGTGE
jgi:hypothetical protein